MVFEFADFELSESLFELRRFGRPVSVQPKVLELIIHLAKNAHRVVTTKELFRSLWPDQVVGETSLRKAIRGARLALGDRGASQGFVRTVRRQGYRFAAPLRERLAPASITGAAFAPFSSACQTVLTVAAVIGYEFSVELLSTCTKTEPNGLTGPLDEGIPHGLIAPVPGTTGLFIFTRAATRMALCEELTGLKLAALRRQVALAVDARGRSDEREQLEVMGRRRPALGPGPPARGPSRRSRNGHAMVRRGHLRCCYGNARRLN